ncbi:UNVERIFIED_ORG: hypothetical protein J2X80_001553 [Pseudomonas fluorescens]|nr:hypothetical protein [Pseudomonas fluorescens]
MSFRIGELFDQVYAYPNPFTNRKFNATELERSTRPPKQSKITGQIYLDSPMEIQRRS